MKKSELVKKLMDLRRKNWSIEDFIEWMEDVVYHTYEQYYIEECIKDEEGRLKGKEVNKEASEYWLGDRVDDEVANIVGDVLILKGKARLE